MKHTCLQVNNYQKYSSKIADFLIPDSRPSVLTE